LRSLMMIDKRSKEFFTSALKYTMEQVQVAELIGHLCWFNHAFSRKIGKAILHGLNNVTIEELKPFIVVMEVYLTVQDMWQELRIEWLFGINSIKMHRPQYHAY
jgi:hypothetical protein